MFAQQMCVDSHTYTPSDGNIYKHMSYAFKCTYSISPVYTFVAIQRKTVAIMSGVTYVNKITYFTIIM
jgi:hypothetical protein